MTDDEKKQLREFLENLYQDEDRVCIRHLTDTKPAKAIKNIVVDNIEDLYNKIISFNKKKLGAVCIAPNPFDKSGELKTENTAALNCVFVDIDKSDLDLRGVPTPHYVFKRTDSNYHLYWLIERLTPTERNRKLYTKIANKLIQRLGGDGNVKDSVRVLRVPFTYHLKNPKKIKGYSLVSKHSIPRYSLNALSVVPSNEESIETKIVNQLPKTVTAGSGRSALLYRLGCMCYAWGVEELRAIEIAEKYNLEHCEPPEIIQIVEHQVKSAYRYSKGPFGEYRDLATTDDLSKAEKYFEDSETIRDALTSFIYVMEAERLINIETGLELTTLSQIESYVAHLTGIDRKFKAILQRGLIEVVDKMDFRPDKMNTRKKRSGRRIYRMKGLRYYNRFSGIIKHEGEYDIEAVRIFKNHVKYLTTSKAEYNHVLNYLSYIVQNPGKKIAHALLIISKFEGIGKSLLEKLMRNILRSPSNVQYVSNVDNSQLLSDYTDFMNDKLLCFIHELAQGDRFSTMNRLKSLITEDSVFINGKYARAYTIRNTTNFIFFSNLLDAIKIGAHDRRLFVVYNDKQPKDSEYYKEVMKIFDHEYYSLWKFLETRDLEDFNPHARPPETAGKDQLKEHSLNELSLYLRDLKENPNSILTEKLILVPELVAFIEDHAPQSIKNKVSIKSIRAWLIENDYTFSNIDKKIKKTRFKHTVYHAKDYIPNDLDIAKVMRFAGEN